jgi:hypothetical protein
VLKDLEMPGHGPWKILKNRVGQSAQIQEGFASILKFVEGVAHAEGSLSNLRPKGWAVSQRLSPWASMLVLVLVVISPWDSAWLGLGPGAEMGIALALGCAPWLAGFGR